MKLYVGNLSFQTSDGELEELFSGMGTVNSASVVTDRDTGRSRGFGFVVVGVKQCLIDDQPFDIAFDIRQCHPSDLAFQLEPFRSIEIWCAASDSGIMVFGTNQGINGQHPNRFDFRHDGFIDTIILMHRNRAVMMGDLRGN